MTSTALITGIAGQDGSYLAGLLHEKGYRIVGILPDMKEAEGPGANPLPEGTNLVVDNLGDLDRLVSIMERYRPDEIYNFAAHSFLGTSFVTPVQTSDLLALGFARLLEAIRVASPTARLFQASSSEIFGNPAEVPQFETTLFRPRNPYGAAKVYSHLLTGVYRETYGIYACCGILYNHESPRRQPEFVTRKVTLGAARIKLGLAAELKLGNLDARRDWGFAGDYVRAMWLMLQQRTPDDYILASGETKSVRDLCEVAFSHLELDYRDHVVMETESFRPPDKAQLVGNPSKACKVLGWNPTVTFEDMIRGMVDADIERIRSGALR
jgi:GDPmannose 4,6-dehydratase